MNYFYIELCHKINEKTFIYTVILYVLKNVGTKITIVKNQQNIFFSMCRLYFILPIFYLSIFLTLFTQSARKLYKYLYT